MVDFTPLFRTAIGFDRLANALETAHRADVGGYPPYDIEVTGDDEYRITMAVAGFEDHELNVEVKENVLRVSGAKAGDNADRRYLHHGIATRSFERNYQLADYVQVKNAELKNGLLHIELVREIPEAMKARRIEIHSNDEKLIEGESKAA